jgi:hypothetical protein
MHHARQTQMTRKFHLGLWKSVTGRDLRCHLTYRVIWLIDLFNQIFQWISVMGQAPHLNNSCFPTMVDDGGLSLGASLTLDFWWSCLSA